MIEIICFRKLGKKTGEVGKLGTQYIFTLFFVEN